MKMEHRGTRGWLVFLAPGLVVLLGANCGARLPEPQHPPGPSIRLIHGGGGTEIDRLLDVLYEKDFSPREARALAHTALDKYPDAAAAHEAAGYLATLADDPHEVWLHFWKAAQDLDSPLTLLYLWELSAEPTHTEIEANVALYEALRAAHPSPTVRAHATIAEAIALRKLGHAAEANTLARTLGFIEDWAILGAFDNEDGKGFLTASPPERAIDFAGSVDGPFVPLIWRRLPAPIELGAVKFARAVAPAEAGMAYLATWVHVDADTDARLCLSTTDATRAWINQGLVLSEARVDVGALDNLTVTARLKKGWNQLLVKSANKNGAWWLRARFTDLHDSPLAGLTYAAEPRPFQPAPDSPRHAQAVPPAIDRVVSANRRAFLAARWLMRDGHPQPRRQELETFLGRTPGNLLATYNLALAYWAGGEAGKAIDLGNRGVERGGTDAPAFLHFRARYYAQRKLYDKAFADYMRELAATDVARMAERDLAALFKERGWREDGCRQLEETARKWPDDAATLGDLGACQLALGYAGRGALRLERAFNLDQANEKIARQLFAHAIDESRFADAARWLGVLQSLAAADPNYQLLSADLARREGHVPEAEQRLRAAVSINPGWALPHERLGDLFFEQRRNQEALAEWKLARRRDPTNAILAQRIEFHEPTRLGFIERYIPSTDAIDEALRHKVVPLPGARVAMLIDDEVTEVESDGSARKVVTLVRQALTEQGRDELIVESVPRVGEVKLLRAYALSKAGEQQEASSIREGKVRFRNLEVGSRVVLQYVHYAPSGRFLKNHYVGSFWFRSPTAQEELARWTLVLPKDRLLRTQVDGPVEVDDTVQGDRRVRIWSAHHVPPLVAETHSPPVADLLARVSVSTVADWDEYVSWERALLAEAFRTTPRLEALTQRLIAGASDPRDKLGRLYDYVAKEIRYQQDYENTVAGVQPHACSIVIERGYGDCKDKAVLLIELAKLAGIKVEFALLRTRSVGKIVRDVPNQQFNHAIAYVPAQPGFAEPLFLDPTADALDSENLPPSDQRAISLVLDPDAGSWQMIEIPLQPPELTSSHVALQVDFESTDKARVAVDLTARGAGAMTLRRTRRTQDLADKVLQGMAARILPGSELTGSTWPADEDTHKPVALHLQIDGSRAIHAEGDHFRFSLASTIDLSPWTVLDRRETALVFGVRSESSETVTFVLPPGYVPVHVPPDFAITHRCGTAGRHVSTAGRTVKIDVVIRQTCEQIDVAHYAEFRDMNRDLINKLRDEISFAKAPASTPGSRASPLASHPRRHAD